MKKDTLTLKLLPLPLLIALLLLLANRVHSSDPLSNLWQSVQRVGSYQFETDITQHVIPAASASNVGKQGKKHHLRLEGATDLKNERASLTLWSQGGHVLDSASGMALKVEDGRTFGRFSHESAWEEMTNVTDSFMPDGDFLSFLAAAENIERVGEETRQGITFTRYTFDVSGEKFAAYLQAENTQQLREQSLLPAGTTLGLSEQVRQMSGSGELWISADGYPLRQLMSLDFPEVEGERVHVNIDATFTIDAQAGAFSWLPTFAMPTIAVGRVLNGMLISSLTLGAAYLLMRRSHSRRLYTAVIVGLVASMVLGTPLSVWAQGTAHDRFSSYSQRQQRLQTDADEQRTMQEAQYTPPTGLTPRQRYELIQADDGTDSDGDGRSDAVEQIQETQPDQFDAAPQTFVFFNAPPPVETGADSDADGLTDYEEGLLGTNPTRSDTDQDGISDFDEIQGFEYAGVQWYGDPLEIDTNRDYMPDGEEWLPNGVRDSDGDGTPDLYDNDNDGDGVPDKLDHSPLVVLDTTFSNEQPLNLVLDGLVENRPIFVDIQLRPTDEKHLWYTTNKLDWPSDGRGNIKDIDRSTDEIALIPMLEVIAPANTPNLPLTDPTFTVTLNPSRFDSIQAGTITITPINELSVGRRYTVTSGLTLPAAIHVRPGSCGALQRGNNPDPIATLQPNESTVIDESRVDTSGGEVRVINNFNMRTNTDGGYVLTVEQDGVVVSCGQIEQEIFVGNQIVDRLALQRYQVSARQLENNNIALYAPLGLMNDQQTGMNVGFAARIPYAGSAEWGAAHEIRMVWVVQIETDTVCVYDRLDSGCQIVRNNVPQVVHTYPEQWKLTALNVSEEHGSQLATIYEDPAIDTNLQDDGALVQLSYGLDKTFLAGRTDADERDVTIDEIARRFNHPTNDGVSLAERWLITDTLRVESADYDSLDDLIAGSVETTKQILADEFTPIRQTEAFTPTLMQAYERSYRALGLNVVDSSPGVRFDGATFTGDFSADANLAPVITDANMLWKPYQYEGDSWDEMSLADYWVSQQAAQLSNLSDEPDIDVAKGQINAFMLYYYTLYSSVTTTVQIGDYVLSQNERLDREINNTIRSSLLSIGSGISSAIKFVVKVYYVGEVLAFASGDTNVASSARDFFKFGFKDLLNSVKNAKPIAGLRDFFRTASPVKQGAVAAALVLAALVLITLIVTTLVLAYIEEIPEAIATFKFLTFAISLALTIYSIYKVISLLRGIANGVANAAGRLGASLTSNLKAGVVGLIITLAIAWGYFFYAWGSGQISLGTLEFESALAFTIAATIVAILFFVINSIPIIGPIITGLIAIIDGLLAFLCEVGVDALVTDGECFSVTNKMTKAIAETFYVGDVIFDFENAQQRTNFPFPQVLNFSSDLRDSEVGLVQGNAVQISADIGGILVPNDPTAPVSFTFTPDAIRTTGLRYEISDVKAEDLEEEDQEAYHATANTLVNHDGWAFELVGTRSYPPPTRCTTGLSCLFDNQDGADTVRLYNAQVPQLAVRSEFIELTKTGIDADYMFPLYLNVGMKIPAFSCFRGDCSEERDYDYQDAVFSVLLVDDGGLLAYDILPTDLDSFYARNWGTYLPEEKERYNVEEEEFEKYYTVTNGRPFTNISDFDGDGVLPPTDPNDLEWDTDGDGLSDKYEIDMRGTAREDGGIAYDPTQADTDGDGICDSDEARLGARADMPDTDLDGLSDGEELWHQDCATGEWTGGYLFRYNASDSTRVNTAPAERDGDNDGLSDRAERLLHLTDSATYKFHPDVVNENPLALDMQTSDFDNVVRSGTGFDYTATLRNELVTDALYINGTFRTNYPAALLAADQTTQFSLGSGQATQHAQRLNASGPSQTVEIVNPVMGSLSNSAETTTANAYPDLTLDERLPIVIDNDRPNSTITTGLYYQADTFNIIGGTSADPTSYVTGVEIDTGSGFVAATGAEQWAYQWLTPATEGRVTIRSRATDAVGFIETPAAETSVIVDATAPVLTGMDGDPIIPAVEFLNDRFAMRLNGTAIDPAIGADVGSGVQQVEVMVEPRSSGWVTATLEGDDWTLYYPLSSIANGQLQVTATGDYTVSVRSVDNVNNQTAPIQFTVRVDDDAPTTSLTSLDSDTSIITDTIQLSGLITDVGDISGGLGSVEVAFTPASLLDDLEGALALFPLNDGLTSNRFAETIGQHDGTCVGTTCPMATVAGVYGNAVEFDGVNDVITSTLDLPENQATLSFWFRSDALNSGILSASDGTDHDRDIYLSNGNLCVFVQGDVDVCTSGTNYADDNWHHVAHILDSAERQKLYVDGTVAATGAAIASGLTTQNSFNLGYAEQASQPYFAGRLDDVAVYDSALSADEVLAIAQRWQPATLAATGADVTATTWQLDLPAGLDGYYQIDVRGADRLGNRSDAERNFWREWRGIIDITAPRIDFDLTYTGFGASARTEIDISAEDFYIDSDSLTSPCETPLDITYSEEAWWRNISGDQARPTGLTQTCAVEGFVDSADLFVRVCDLAGRCAAVTPNIKLLYWGSNQTGVTSNRIDRASLFSGDSHTPVFAYEPPLQTNGRDGEIRALDLDTGRNHLYWLEEDRATDTGTIFRSTLDGNSVITLIENIALGRGDAFDRPGLAVDPDGGKLYWSSGAAIFWANLDGSAQAQLLTTPNPDGETNFNSERIVVDRVGAMLYWSAAGSPTDSTFIQSRLWRANLDGSNAEMIVELAPDFAAADIAIDDSRIYWLRTIVGLGATGGDAILSANLDGSDVQNSGISVQTQGFSGMLELDNGYAYWSNLNLIEQGDLSSNAVGTFFDMDSVPFGGVAEASAIGIISGRAITTTDLILGKSDPHGLAPQGGTITYQITVQNSGLLPARNVVLADTLPTGLSYQSSSVTCTPTGICTLPDLAPNETLTLTLTAAVDAGATGTLVNQATVSSDTPEVNYSNNSAQVAYTVAAPQPTATPETAIQSVYLGANGAIGRLNLATNGEEFGIIGYPAIDNANFLIRGIAVDDVAGEVYWTQSDGSVKRADLDGTNGARIATGNAPTALSFYRDATQRYLFWIDGNDIHRYDLNSSNDSVVLALNNAPTALHVSSARGHIFFAGLDARIVNKPSIMRADLDGSNVTPLVVGELLTQHLTLDEFDGKLYWASLGDKAIKRANAGDGSSVETVTNHSGYVSGLFVDAAADNLYFLRRGDQVFDNDLMRVSVNGGVAQVVIENALPSNAGIAQAYVQPTLAPTQTPVPQPSATATPLPTPLPTVAPPVVGSADSIYFVNDDTIRRAPITGCTDGSCVSGIYTDASNNIDQFAVDNINQTLYWLTADSTNSLKRVPVGGLNDELLVESGDFSISAFTLDAEGDSLYYFNRQGANGDIVRMDMTTLVTESLLTIPTDFVPAMVVDRPNGYIYWHSQADEAIQRASLSDGSNVETVVNGAGVIGQFSGAIVSRLEIDAQRNWLFWQSDGGELRRADLNCANVNACVFATYQKPSGGYNDFAVSSVTAELYWSAFDGGTQQIEVAPINGSGAPTLVVGGVAFVGDIALGYPAPTCSPDSYEPDNDSGSATLLTRNVRSMAHTISAPNDADWFALDLTAGHTIGIDVHASGNALVPQIDLFASDGTTLVASNGGDLPSLKLIAAETGRYYLRVTNGITTYACNTEYSVGYAFGSVGASAELPPVPDSDAYEKPILDSSVFADDSTPRRSAGVLLEGGAYARDYLQALSVRVDGQEIYSDTWAAGTLTQTTYATVWNAPSDGIYTVESLVQDWAGRTQTETHPLEVVIDGTPPTVTLDANLFVGVGAAVSFDGVRLSGTATDNVGIVQVLVRLDGGAAISADYNNGTWQLPLNVANNDGGSLNVTIIARDRGGNVTTINETVTVDVEPPSAEITALHAGQVITAYQTIETLNPTLTLAWGAVTDGSGVDAVYAGWTISETATLAELTRIAGGTADSHSEQRGEAEIVYGHVVLVDVHGNEDVTTIGPIYLDSIQTPDLIDDLSYERWAVEGAQLSADNEITAGSRAYSDIGRTQKLFASWDADALRLRWEGGNWETQGDLYIYLDTAILGATTLYDPYNSGSNIGFPAGMTPNHMLIVTKTATLYEWTAGWNAVATLDATQFERDDLTIDALLPFAQLGIDNSSPLGLLAVASEQDALKLWAAAPDHNPLNSERVINRLAAGRDLSDYDLTLYHEWSSLAFGQVPNAGRFADSDLVLSIESEQAAVSLGYLESDLLDILTPDVPLDADSDGEIDVALPFDVDPLPLGDGAVVTYTIRYANNGAETVTDVTLDLTQYGALVLDGGTTVSIGDVAAGESGEVVVTGRIDSGLDGDSAELNAALSDGEHGSYDWFWLQHDVDTAPPSAITIDAPTTYVRPITQTIVGTVEDESGVPLVELETRPQAARALIQCPDPRPADKQWTCEWNPGDLTGLASIDTRVRGTDEYGNVGDWSAWKTLIVDTNAPTVTFEDGALDDGYIGMGEGRLTGLVTDDREAESAEICLNGACQTLDVNPDSAASGRWATDLPIADTDGLTVTLVVTGTDAVGNLSQPITSDFRIDTVAPVITVTNAMVGDVVASGMLEGMVSDGGELDKIFVRVERQYEDTTWSEATVNGDQWSFDATTVRYTERYTLTVEAYDMADNARFVGPFFVDREKTAVDLVQVGLSHSNAAIIGVLAGVLLIGSAWSVGRRRRIGRKQHL